MASFDFFRRRRERESAIPAHLREALTAELGPDAEPGTGPGFPEPGADQPPGAGPEAAVGPGELVSMVHESLKTGEIQVAQGESRTIDLSGPGLGEEIREALRRHGIDPGQDEDGARH